MNITFLSTETCNVGHTGRAVIIKATLADGRVVKLPVVWSLVDFEDGNPELASRWVQRLFENAIAALGHAAEGL